MTTRIFLALIFMAASLTAETPARHYLQGPCAKTFPKHTDFGLGDFRLEKNDRYRNTPVVAFTIHPDGKITDIRLVRSSGISRLDAFILNAVKNWELEPRSNCPVIETEMSVTIDWF